MSSRTLVVLLVVDVLLLAVALVRSPVLESALPRLHRFFAPEVWSIQTDNSYPEVYGYAKEAGAAVLLVWLAVVARQAVHLAWAGLFLAVLLDDALSVHERVGGWVAAGSAVPDELLGVRARDLGEVIGWGVLTALPLLAVVVTHRRAGPAARALSRALAVLVAALVFFGLAVDLLHIGLRGTGQLGRALGVAEDGGELVVLSVLVAVLAGAVRVARVEVRST